MKKRLLLVVCLMMVGSSLIPVFAGGQSEDAVSGENQAASGTQLEKQSWKFATGELEEDFMSVFAKKFGEEINKRSDGKIDVTVFPIGTLGSHRDTHELLQDNVVQLVFSDFGWLGGFVPQVQVMGLPYIWPKKDYKEVFLDVVKNGDAVKMLEEKFRERGLQPIAYLTEGWMTWSTNRETSSLEDMEGLKMRVMPAKILVESFKSYGASPTPMDFSEVYSGLQLGVIDGQANPLWVAYTMGFYEVQDYFTNAYDNLFVAIVSMNKDTYDALPQETQEDIHEIWESYIEEGMEWQEEKEEEYIKLMLEERPEISITEFGEGQIENFRSKAESVYDVYTNPEIGGEGASEFLEVLQNDIKRAVNK